MERRQAKEQKWMQTQILGLKSWVNSFLSRRNQKIEDLDTDFRDGVRLSDFLELASKRSLQGIDLLPKGKIQCIQNLAICLEFMSSLGIRLLGINAGSIYDGKTKLILGMLWSVCRSPAFTNISSDDDASQKGKQSFESQLLTWVQQRIAPYGLSAVDFKNSFSNGMVFGALVHSIDNGAVDMQTLSPMEPGKNLSTVFDAAFEKLNIPKLLDADEIVQGNVDERSIVLYATLLFHAANAAESAAQEAKTENAIEKEMEEQINVEKDIESSKAAMEETLRLIGKEIRAADDMNAENERLKKLIEYYQNRSKLSDATIAALESQAAILDQLSCDKDKRLLQSTTSKALVGVDANGKLVSSHDVVSDDCSWYLAPVEGGEPGEVTVLHSKSKLFLTQKESGADAQLTEGLGEGSKWKVIDNENGSLVQNTSTGDYLKLGDDGSISLEKEAGAGAFFNVQSKSDFLQKREMMRESAVIAASLVEDGGSKMLRNTRTKKFVTSGDGSAPGLSATLGDTSKWGVVMGEKGAAFLRSKETGQFLTQNDSGLGFSADKSAASSWLFARSANRKELYVVNQQTGDYISQDGDSLTTVSEKDAKSGANSGWAIQTEQVKLAGAIADALAAHGGVAFLQNGWTQGYANNIPGLRGEIEKDSEWSMTATPEGSLNIQSNQTGEYLTQGKDGEIIMSDEKVDGSHWSVALGPDRDILLSNRVTGDYLVKSEDGVGLAIAAEKNEQGGGWVVRSVDGQFSTSSQEFRDAAMGTALANAFAAAGGSTLFQHGATKGYMNNNLGLSDGLNEGTQWEVVGHADGSWSLRSKADGQFLSLDDGGSLNMSDDIDSVVSQWKVSRNKNGDILIQNKGTGDYLERGDDGKLGVNAVTDESKGGWVVKSDNASFSTQAGEAGFCDGGFSLRELEERRRNLQSDIASAKAKVAEDASRREQLDRDIQNMKDFVSNTALKADEASKTVDEMEKKIKELKGLFDAEQSEKSQAEEARESAEKELKDKEQLLREIQEKREALKRQLELSKQAAQREIALRRERDLAIRKLESEQARLRKEIVITGKTLAGLDSLKRNLDEHLEELCAREGEESSSIDAAALSKDLEGLSIEEQMKLLDGKIQKESNVLLDIMKIEEIKKDLDPEVLKTGELFIKDKDNWNSRYCRLAGRQFKYYASKDDEKAEGTVDLSLRCEAIRQKAQKEGKTKVWPLKVTVNTVDESGKKIESKLFLRASSKAERHSWFAAFSCITTRVNYLFDVEKEGERPDTRILDFVSTGEGAPIHELSVDYRPISESGCNALRKGILYHDTIRTLSLQNAQIKDEGMTHLVTALDKVTDLRILRVSGNSVTSEGAAKLFAALCMQNTSLREIDVSNNKIDGTGVADLLKLITSNPHLSSINLSSNLLGDEGAASVAAALSKAQAPVPSLDLNHNKIGDKGAAAIAELISNSTHITSVNLVGNEIGDEGAAKLADAIAAQPAIESVDLSNNQLGVKGVVLFRKALEQNASLKSVNLSGNENLHGTEELSQGLLGVSDFSLSNLCMVRGSTGPVKISDVVSDEEE
uniref:Uncharacterized protein n=1 Tax=Paramoeba aestuarina TaxID=180227 RepID=A0A7S4K9R2_9EUKA